VTAINATGAGSSVLPSVSIRNLSFGFGGKPLFVNLNRDLGNSAGAGNDNSGEGNPAVMLGPSGCGKTTLLRLVAGLLKGRKGEVVIRSPVKEAGSITENRISFVFQEPRLLPWKTVLENVMLPIAGLMGKKEALKRARHFLGMVSLGDKEAARPPELSGGQQQRAGIARAFAYPCPVILMDEPFQSLDIPLRIQLMDLTKRLLRDFPRLAIMVTHDPREAVYMGNRIIVLGPPPGGVVFDEHVKLPQKERRYGSVASAEIEERILQAMRAETPVI
jgi:NitT/TauT family transport system ATP-binding protein